MPNQDPPPVEPDTYRQQLAELWREARPQFGLFLAWGTLTAIVMGWLPAQPLILLVCFVLIAGNSYLLFGEQINFGQADDR